MFNPEIQYLYKYRPFNEYSVQNLKDETVWAAGYKTFNDPFDCSLEITENFSIQAYRRYMASGGDFLGLPRKLIKKAVEGNILHGKLTQEAKEALFGSYRNVLNNIENMGIFCLSEVPDNILMWSHYGDCHRGFCMEFERKPDNSLGYRTHLPKFKLGAKQEYSPLTSRVLYSDSYPDLSILDILSAKDPVPGLCQLLLTKAQQWSYEKEWRLLSEGANILRPAPANVTSVIFGLRMSEDHKKIVADIFAGRGSVRFRQAIKSPKSFSLDLVDI